MLYDHWSKIPINQWKKRYPNFHPSELASNGDGSLLIDVEALDALQRLRTLTGKPIFINSAYRDPIYNARIGGAPRSMHKEGKAFDISLRNYPDKQWLIQKAIEAGFTGIGASYRTFLHVDTGRKRRW